MQHSTDKIWIVHSSREDQVLQTVAMKPALTSGQLTFPKQKWLKISILEAIEQ